MNDREIVNLYWQRSEQAITETEQKYGRYCHIIAYNILENSEDSEECVNDTWLHAWNAMPPQKPSVLSAFLGRITRNLSFDLYKLGYQSIDVGHVDIEYEWFLRNAKRKIPIILLLKTNMLMKKEMDINGSLLLVIKIIIGK